MISTYSNQQRQVFPIESSSPSTSYHSQHTTHNLPSSLTFTSLTPNYPFNSLNNLRTYSSSSSSINSTTSTQSSSQALKRFPSSDSDNSESPTFFPRVSKLLDGTRKTVISCQSIHNTSSESDSEEGEEELIRTPRDQQVGIEKLIELNSSSERVKGVLISSELVESKRGESTKSFFGFNEFVPYFGTISNGSKPDNFAEESLEDCIVEEDLAGEMTLGLSRLDRMSKEKDSMSELIGAMSAISLSPPPIKEEEEDLSTSSSSISTTNSPFSLFESTSTLESTTSTLETSESSDNESTFIFHPSPSFRNSSQENYYATSPPSVQTHFNPSQLSLEPSRYQYEQVQQDYQYNNLRQQQQQQKQRSSSIPAPRGPLTPPHSRRSSASSINFGLHQAQQANGSQIHYSSTSPHSTYYSTPSASTQVGSRLQSQYSHSVSPVTRRLSLLSALPPSFVPQHQQSCHSPYYSTLPTAATVPILQQGAGQLSRTDSDLVARLHGGRVPTWEQLAPEMTALPNPTTVIPNQILSVDCSPFNSTGFGVGVGNSTSCNASGGNGVARAGEGGSQPIVNTGNQGPMVVQAGDWKCGVCAFVNWRRRKICMRCFPFANDIGNAITIATINSTPSTSTTSNLLNTPTNLASHSNALNLSFNNGRSTSANEPNFYEQQRIERERAMDIDQQRLQSALNIQHQQYQQQQQKAFESNRPSTSFSQTQRNYHFTPTSTPIPNPYNIASSVAMSNSLSNSSSIGSNISSGSTSTGYLNNSYYPQYHHYSQPPARTLSSQNQINSVGAGGNLIKPVVSNGALTNIPSATPNPYLQIQSSSYSYYTQPQSQNLTRTTYPQPQSQPQSQTQPIRPPPQSSRYLPQVQPLSPPPSSSSYNSTFLKREATSLTQEQFHSIDNMNLSPSTLSNGFRDGERGNMIYPTSR